MTNWKLQAVCGGCRDVNECLTSGLCRNDPVPAPPPFDPKPTAYIVSSVKVNYKGLYDNVHAAMAMLHSRAAPDDARLDALYALDDLKPQLAWSPAPQSVEWGDEMMVADLALSNDETLTLYVHKDALK